ncbi:multimerin-1 isoform X2 [Tachyglossus aculeatus]|uniref:multimerin-1 isoform X2 n=1 Tax=Tachyglossus aculeatus TaxID=9261 RepID=UPI0018F445DB|nr:multimerin-1 isoform X2 [Tachyglossus aculeatus]
MKGLCLFVLFPCLWSSELWADSTTQSWTASQEDNFLAKTSPVTTPLLQTQGSQEMTMSSEVPLTAHTSKPPGTLQKPAPVPSESSPAQALSSRPTPPPSEKNKDQLSQEGMLKLKPFLPPTQSRLEPGSSPAGPEAAGLSDRTRQFLESFSRKQLTQGEETENLSGARGNRSPRQTYFGTGSSSPNGVSPQSSNFKNPGFETTRGKNWCAYVHTQLSPTVVMDQDTTFQPGPKPCRWTSTNCAGSFQKISRPIYRMKHKIVTSLEWKCCPGYRGEKCQQKVPPSSSLIHSNQAESSRAIDEQSPGSGPQRDCSEQETQKITDQINHQEVKLTLLQKKIENISVTMDDVRTTFSSLEGKISDAEGTEFQTFLKGLKSKSISELVKDSVREQFKVFQNEVQENVAQLFKAVSTLSEGLESTRQLAQHVNESLVSISSQQKAILDQESTATRMDLLELKNDIANVKQEMSFVYEKPIKALEARQKELADSLELEHTRNILYYESLNKSLLKMREVHKQLLASDRKAFSTVQDDVITEGLLVLQEKVKKQDLTVIKMYDDLNLQENKVNNITVTLQLERATARKECEVILSKYRKDFQSQMKDMEENLHILNQTLADTLFPMYKQMDKMNEQIKDLTYDMEILQPLTEQGPPFHQFVDSEQSNRAAASNRKLDNLTSIIYNLKHFVKELAKSHEEFKIETQASNHIFERRINECTLQTEDGLNKSMTILNNAIDSIQDNYVQRETLTSKNSHPEAHDNCSDKMGTILAFIPQFRQLNESFHSLINDIWRNQTVLQNYKALKDSPNGNYEKTSHSNFGRLDQILNGTISQVLAYQQNISHLEEKLFLSTQAYQDYAERLQNLESRVTQTWMPFYISFKKDRDRMERDQSLQLQVLSSRFKALEAKSIYFSVGFSRLNRTVYETLEMCQHASDRISHLNASSHQLMQDSQSDFKQLQEDLLGLMESKIEAKTQALQSNITWYLDQVSDQAKAQKQMKASVKKPATLKKPAVNLITILKGRNQRNTDSIENPEDLDCSRSPCQNGGTCISGRNNLFCACRHPFGGNNCTERLTEENSLTPDFSKGSYRYAPMVSFFVSHTYGMTGPGPIKFNNLDVNYGASYATHTGKFQIPYLGVYVFKYTIESLSPQLSGYLVVDGVDKLAFQSENVNSDKYWDRVLTGDALLELNYGQEVWLRLVKGSIPGRFPPVSTFSGFLLYRT